MDRKVLNVYLERAGLELYRSTLSFIVSLEATTPVTHSGCLWRFNSLALMRAPRPLLSPIYSSAELEIFSARVDVRSGKW